MLRQFIILIALKKSRMLISSAYHMTHLCWSEKVPDNDTVQSDHPGSQQNQRSKFLDVSSITYSMPSDDDF